MGIDLEQPSGEYHKEDSRQNVNVVAVDGADEGLYRDPTNVCLLNSARNVKENMGPTAEKRLDKGSKSQTGAEINLNSSKNLEPHDGMEFESKEEAFSFYKEYAKSVGFAGVIKASRRSRVTGKFIDAKFACTRYGTKRESSADETPEGVSNADGTTIFTVKRKRGRVNRSWEKTDCKACLHVKTRDDGRWIISSFTKEHNHEIFPDQAYYFRGHRNLELGSSDTDALHAIRARTKKMYVTMSRQSGGHKKNESQKGSGSNQLQGGQILALDEGDAQVMLDHFIDMQDENPNFFYAIDLNKEQQLRNVLWVDAKGRLDYCNFCDVVLFDITYIRNEYKLPLAPFIGVNHHCQFLLLGCALVADESRSTYVWLLRAWFRAMGRHAPKVILTDQDCILKEAIAEVFPDSRHCFCLWHIMNKVPEKLGYVMRQHEKFMAKFNKCIFKSWTTEQFEKRWWKMADRFHLRTDLWFQSLYEDRERWVPTYMKEVFLAGLSTTQRSESINCFLDKYMQRKTTLKEFIEQYKGILREKAEEEVKADFETWNKQPALKSPSPFGKQMAAIYTHAIFKKFQVEVLGVVACHPRKETEDGEIKTFRVQDFEENQNFIVEWNESTSDVSCLCRSFEFNGFVCRHVMIVLQMSGVHSIPSQCILKRWTKDAKSRQTLRGGSEVVESRVIRYNDICQRAFKLSDEGSLSQESYNIAFSALEEALRKCESINNSIQTETQPSSPSHSPQRFEEVNLSSRTSMENKKNGASKKGQVHSEPVDMAVRIQESWQHMEQMNSENSEKAEFLSIQTERKRKRKRKKMSHAAFQTAQIMLINTQHPVKPKGLPSLPTPKVKPVGPTQLVVRKIWRGVAVPAPLKVSASSSSSSSSSAVAGEDSMALLERCFVAPPAPGTTGPVMKGGKYGAFGATTLEKSKLNLSQKQSKSSPETAVGGGGGDIGKNLNNGGGDGGDDNGGGDDDEYFDDFDEGDEGDEGGLFRRRMFLEELFDRKFVDAVLNEWQKTMMDLPAGFRQAYEMGLVSSAQMVKFLAINARPTTNRLIYRSLPEGISRAFIGRMIADPTFLYRLLLEQAATIGFAVRWELKNRRERIKQEWDLALVNVLTVAACNAIVVWSLAPCRSYGNTFRFDLQNTLQKLPNNIFEKSYPLREFDLQKRVHSFFYKAAQLCMVGLTAGALQGSLSNFLASKKEGRLSVTIPSARTNALGYGAFLGLYANLRYQLLCGFDKTMINYFDVIGVGLFFSTALRILNVQLGESSRLAWLGVEADPLAQSENLLKAYNRPSENVDQSSSKWFISKNGFISGLGLLGIKQSNVDSAADGESSAPRARRKRIVRKKVASSS